jgi:hypothetical protein
MNVWKPEIVEPHVAIVGFEEIGFQLGDEDDRRHRGVTLSKLLTEHANEDPYEPPAFGPDPEKPKTPRMRYTGPNFFRLAHLLEDVATLQQAYYEIMPRIWLREFGDDVAGVQPLPAGRRAADAFIANPQKGEATNWHDDGYLTVSGYPAPGAGLVISHCVNPRDNSNDLKEQPATLVLPRVFSLVFFLGNQHPHRGIDLGRIGEQPADEQETAWANVKDEYKVERVVHNFGVANIDQNLGVLAPWEELEGDRLVMAFDFGTRDIETSLFDRVLGGI